MKDDNQNKIQKLQEIYDQFLMDLSVLQKERAEILAEFSQRLDQVKVSKIEKILKTNI